ncbi:MAG TPA: hypothetical protein VFQ07_11900, partial [Candidatus Polarisedimenticolia bacterium]|nr:hypothetical protein [Candidatus Polarisedimenticolia bacterium]
HICRCGTYQRIRTAVKRAARNAAGPQGPRQGGRRQATPPAPGAPGPGAATPGAATPGAGTTPPPKPGGGDR